MSARLFKKTVTSSSVSVSSGGSAAASPSRSRSPSSPARTSRLEEKQQLAGLNDRLATYIEKVRSLEIENNRLSLQVKSSQETVTREVSNIKSLYESELADARRLLDETARERAKLQIDLGNLKTDRDDLATKLMRRERELEAAQKQVTLQESQIRDLQSRLDKAIGDRERAENELKEAQLELHKLRKQLEELRKQLESEALARVDMENRCQSLKEELEFKSSIYEEQLTETRSRRSQEISELDGQLQTEYEARLLDSLQEIREQYELQMKTNREEIETIYENKLEELRGSQARNQSSTASTLRELRETKARIDGLSSKISELEGANATLHLRIRDLEKQLDDERTSSASMLRYKSEEIERLEEQMRAQMQEYRDLLDIKVALDVEISAYRKLLESEEARLHLSPASEHTASSATREGLTSSSAARGSVSRSTPAGGRSGKRKRMVLESEEAAATGFAVANTCHGDVEIVDECPDGKFVKLRNKSNKEVSLGGMQLIRKAGDNETDYKFHRSIKLGAGEETTVWASEANATHDAPHNLVMKGQTWFVADKMTTTLFDMEGEEIAQRVSQRESHSTSFTTRHQGVISEQVQEAVADVSAGSDWSLLNLFGGGRKAIRQ